MAAFKGNLFGFVLITLFINILSQNDNNYEDISKCSCDLTANGCDPNCCCDVECDENDIAVFSECIDEYTPVDDRMCVQEEVVWRDNTRFTTETTDNGLFCVQTDNNAKRNYYEVPDFVETENKFNEYRSIYGSYSFQIKPKEFPFSSNDYQSGDPVMTVYESEAVGYLGQPTAMSNGHCKDSNPVSYLSSLKNECVRPFEADLQQECVSNVALNAAVYYRGFKVLSTPRVYVGTPPSEESTESPVTTSLPITDSGVTVLYNSSYAIPVEPADEHLCIDVDGINTTCSFADLPPPQYDPATGACKYAVVKVLYTLYWNGSDGIGQVVATFVFQDITEQDLPLVQAFQTDFLKRGEEDATAVSGTPGYVVGLPVLAGDLITNENSNRQTRVAIDLSTDLSNRLSIVISGPDGLCVDSANKRVAVNFGENLRSGCFLKVFYNNISDFCSLYQEQAKTALLGNNIVTHVATFGDSQVTETGDWVEILTDDLPTAAADGEDGCVNMLTGMHWEIMFANAGALSNPQAKIIGVTYRYTTQKIRFQCYGAYCQPGSPDQSQMVEIVSSVGFIDASRQAVGETAKQPIVSARLPSDFFYPFS